MYPQPCRIPRRYSNHEVHSRRPLPSRRWMMGAGLVGALLGFGVGYCACYERDSEVMTQVYRQRQLVRALTEAIHEPLPFPSPILSDHSP